MSNINVKTEEVEKGGVVVSGSLAALVSSYGDSDSCGESGDDDDRDPATNSLSKDLLPNPFCKKEQELCLLPNPLHEPPKDSAEGQGAPVVVKIEPKEEDGTATANQAGPKDFNSVCQANGGTNLELSVDDFLTGAESYGEARPIKVEVESDVSETESEESTDDSEEDEDDVDPSEQDNSEKVTKKLEGPKVKGEMSLYDLPPIEDLHISVPHEECKPIGEVKSVVEPLVIVEAYLGTPALNLDSVLFLEEGDRALGHIFDVIGPVKQPLYCVRFNSKEHIEKYKIEVGMRVYCAPKTPYTTYVFLAQLKRMKGSDASWLNDIEPPDEEREFSDDEMEKIAKKKKKNRKRLQKMQATEEDAMHREEADNSAMQNRGQKRHYNYNIQNQFEASNMPHPHGGGYERPRFLPPSVPGFAPRHNHGSFHGYPSHRPWYPDRGRARSHHRGFVRHGGSRGFHRFQSTESVRAPNEWPSCPPFQWSPQNGPNIDFVNNTPNPYQTLVSNIGAAANPLPPPPPPPGV